MKVTSYSRTYDAQRVVDEWVESKSEDLSKIEANYREAFQAGFDAGHVQVVSNLYKPLKQLADQLDIQFPLDEMMTTIITTLVEVLKSKHVNVSESLLPSPDVNRMLQTIYVEFIGKLEEAGLDEYIDHDNMEAGLDALHCRD